jgi:glycyl-tRNA synthetase (class II)
MAEIEHFIDPDHDTIKDDGLYETITIRDRDTRYQHRVKIDNISSEIIDLLNK